MVQTIRYCLFLFCLYALSAGADVKESSQMDTINLLFIPEVAAPLVDNKTARMHVDFVFDTCPQEYWLHYSKRNRRLVAEFLGVHINASKLRVKGTSVVSDIDVTNNVTDFVLSGKSSQLSMELLEGWHYEGWVVGRKMFRLQLWMPLKAKTALPDDPRKVFIPLAFTGFGVALLTYITIWFITGHR